MNAILKEMSTKSKEEEEESVYSTLMRKKKNRVPKSSKENWEKSQYLSNWVDFSTIEAKRYRIYANAYAWSDANRIIILNVS